MSLSVHTSEGIYDEISIKARGSSREDTRSLFSTLLDHFAQVVAQFQSLEWQTFFVLPTGKYRNIYFT